MKEDDGEESTSAIDINLSGESNVSGHTQEMLIQRHTDPA